MGGSDVAEPGASDRRLRRLGALVACLDRTSNRRTSYAYLNLGTHAQVGGRTTQFVIAH